ncbi:MAG: branched-chain amino acid ABC transporter permease [Hyphomicrobiales bacterium]|nr:branched-chain amino acid ABC transporter permease [Hyphomicrobiales bacterium]
MTARATDAIPQPPRLTLPLVLHARTGLLVMLVCLIGAPLLLSDYELTQFSTSVAYSVAVLGVSLGFSSVGMLALTQPAMMVIGGFVALHLIELWSIPFLLAAASGTVIGMLIAVPLGWLTCRLDKFSFAVLGFAFTYLVAMLASSRLLVDATGGELGKPFPAARAFGNPLNGFWTYGLVAAVSLASFAVAAILFRSTMGRILLVMNQDDVVARTAGVNTNLHRISLTAIVSGYGALSGALVGQASGFLAPPQFDVALSISLLAMALVGGSGYLIGAFVGAMALNFAPAVLGFEQIDREIIVGTLLLFCLLAAPKGMLAGFGRIPLPRRS